MIFNSLTFLVFFVIVMALHYAPFFCWHQKKINLMIASYLFYAAWNPPFVILLWVSTVVDWWAAQWMVRAKRERTRKIWMLTSVCVNLGMLGYFKYGGFLLDNFVGVAASLGIIYHPPGWDIILPVGISFYTFATLSYTLDVYLRRSAPAGSFLNYALFVTFFPHLVAGPIMRPTELVPQFEEPRQAKSNQIFFGLALLTLGLFQKVVLADGFLAPVVEAVYDAQGKMPGMLDVVGRNPGVRRADLLRFRGLFDVGDRRRAVPGLCNAGQFPFPLRSGRLLRLLAALAHHLVELAARLSLHSARREPSRPGADLCGIDGHDAAGRPVARRELDVRGVGRPSRHVPLGRALAAGAVQGLHAGASIAARPCAADLPPRQHHLGLLPREDLRGSGVLEGHGGHAGQAVKTIPAPAKVFARKKTQVMLTRRKVSSARPSSDARPA